MLGLFEGVVSEQIEDQDRQAPGEGMRRSIRNSLLIGLISGILLGLLGLFCVGPSQGLRIGLSQGVSLVVSNILNIGLMPGQNALDIALDDLLNYGLSYGLNIGLPLGISGGVLVCLISGGLAAWRHYMLRFLLWQTHMFPWKAERFLNDATTRFLLRRMGGGYSFMHRLLLDSFANSDPASS